MHRIAIAVVCLLAGCSSFESAGPADKSALARRLVEQQYGPELLVASGEAYADEYIRRMPDYSDYCETAANEEYCRIGAAGMTAEIKRAVMASAAEVTEYRTGTVEKLTALYAEAYTMDELRAAVAFIDSPEGRSIEAKAPMLMREAAAIEYDALRQWTDSVDAKVAAIMAMFGSAFATSTDEQ